MNNSKFEKVVATFDKNQKAQGYVKTYLDDIEHSVKYAYHKDSQVKTIHHGAPLKWVENYQLNDSQGFDYAGRPITRTEVKFTGYLSGSLPLVGIIFYVENGDEYTE